MDTQLRVKILELLARHRIMSLATLRPDGWPQATTVGYVSDGLTLYFMCGRDSQKAANLARDDRVSLTIDRDTTEPMAIEGLSMAGHARRVIDQARIREMMLIELPRKYPEYGPMMDAVDLEAIAVFMITPVAISVLDYSKGFGHADLVSPEAADLQPA